MHGGHHPRMPHQIPSGGRPIRRGIAAAAVGQRRQAQQERRGILEKRRAMLRRAAADNKRSRNICSPKLLEWDEARKGYGSLGRYWEGLRVTCRQACF